MSSEPAFIDSIDIKEEVINDHEVISTNPHQMAHLNSSKTNLKVQVISYKDIEGIKEEVDSENEEEGQVSEEFVYENGEDEESDQVNEEYWYKSHRDSDHNQENSDFDCQNHENSNFDQENYRNSYLEVQNHDNMEHEQQSSLKDPNYHPTSISHQNSSKTDQNLENFEEEINIKTEDNTCFKIIQINPTNHIQLANNQLNSVLEFENEQKTSFRLPEHQENDDDEEFVLQIKEEEESEDENTEIYQEAQTHQEPTKPNLPDLDENDTENFLAEHILKDSIRKYGNYLKISPSCTQKLSYYSKKLDVPKFPNNSKNGSDWPENSGALAQRIKASSLLENLAEKLKSPWRNAENSTRNQENLTKSHENYSDNSKNDEIAEKSEGSLSNSITQDQSPTDSTNSSQDSSKNSQSSIQNQENPNSNLKNPQTTTKPSYTFKPMTQRCQVISKPLKVDPEEAPDLPKNIMEKYNLKKFTTNVERRQGSIFYVYSVPYYVCMICSTIFVSHNNFFRHFKLCHSKTANPFDCWRCKSTFSTWTQLVNHMKCHEDSKQYTCKHCFYPFKFKDSLTKHLEKVHGDKIKKISCEICGRNFDTEKEMLTHKHRHTGMAQIIRLGEPSVSRVQKTMGIKCIFCPMQFFRNEDLEKHYQTHKSLEKMRCRSCGKDVMVNPQYIIKNIKMREFKCILCSGNTKEEILGTELKKPVTVVNNQIKIEKNQEKPAVSETSIVANSKSSENSKDEHKKVITVNLDKNTRKMTVKCYVCGIELISNIKLFWHMKGHLEQHTFNCPVCQENFETREEMIEHCKVEHKKDNVTKCDICKKQFHFVDLATHMKTHVIVADDTNKTEKPKEQVKLPTVTSPSSDKGSYTHKATGIVIKPNLLDHSIFFGSKCLICKEYVLNKNMAAHKLQHDQEKSSKLAKQIQFGRKKEEFLKNMKNSSQKLINGNNDGGSSRIILKRKIGETTVSQVGKRIKIEEES